MGFQILLGNILISLDRDIDIRPAPRDLALEPLGGLALGGDVLAGAGDDERPVGLDGEGVDRPARRFWLDRLGEVVADLGAERLAVGLFGGVEEVGGRDRVRRRGCGRSRP